MAGNFAWPKICGYFWSFSTLPPAEPTREGNRIQLLSSIGISNGQYWITASTCMYFTLIYVLLLRLTMKWQDRLETFMTMVREWHHLKMLKCAGRAFDTAGIAVTAPGSLAIPCHACPLPNINLPKGWDNVPPAWVYVFHLDIYFASYYSTAGFILWLLPWTLTSGLKVGCEVQSTKNQPWAWVGPILWTMGHIPISSRIMLMKMRCVFLRYDVGPLLSPAIDSDMCRFPGTF